MRTGRPRARWYHCLQVSSGLPVPSATLVLLREARAGMEVLLVRRDRRLAFHGGAWVFPGGRIDGADHDPAGDPLLTARRAAARETLEETSLVVHPDGFVPLACWTTPPGRPRRFRTWFFLAPAEAGEVRVDGSEIQSHRWMRPADALRARQQGEMDLPPPTFVTLNRLGAYASPADALAAHAASPPEVFTPRPRVVEGGAVSLYEGDAAYEGLELDSGGPRHRLWMLDAGWRYERDGDLKGG
jgi:8-oxo-dGTP pyrophosphatase MutT (NUDIX family)